MRTCLVQVKQNKTKTKVTNIFWNKKLTLKKLNMPEPMLRGKDTLMSDEMEEFITDTIIIAEVKNGGDTVKMADAIKKKLDEHFGGM